MDILTILEELTEEAVHKPKSFGPLTYGLKKDAVIMLISQVRANLPKELKDAATTVRESDRIIETAREDAGLTVENAKKEAERLVAEAKEEADRLVQQAKLEQEQMVQENEILKISKAQSEEIRSRAERDALETRRGADNYAYQVLDHLGKVVQKAYTGIEDGKKQLEPVRDVAPVPKERVRS